MTCKECEILLSSVSGREKTPAEWRALETHLQACPRCRRFESDLRSIRNGLRDESCPEPPEALASRTRQSCLAELASLKRQTVKRADPPAIVTVVIVLLVVLTAACLTIALQGVDPGQPVPLEARAALLIIIQNIMILFFAPVLLRRTRFARRDGNSYPQETI